MQTKSFFLGFDISKLTIDYDLINGQDKSLLRGQIANSEAGCKQLQKALMVNGFKDFSLILFGMENTGSYCNPIKLFCVKNKFDLVVANAYDVCRSKGMQRAKSDSVDSFVVAQYLRKNLPTVKLYVPDRKAVELLKKLQSARSLLVKMKTQLSNHMGEAKSFFDIKDYKILEKNLKEAVMSVQVSIVNLEKQMDKVLCSDESLKENAEIMESMPGVGRQTALRLITATNNFETISDPRKAACHAGVAPFKNESGTSRNLRPKVSKMADQGLKKTLFLAAMSAVQHCRPIKLYYEKKVSEGKEKMSVLNAVANKILHMIFAMISKRQLYKETLFQ
jgi:transposase